MPPSTTKKPLQNWAPRISTAEVSPGSENTSDLSKVRGQKAEERVLKHFLQQGWSLFRRNHKVAGVEVDLLFQYPRWTLVEVKTLRSFSDIAFRLSPKQKNRLLWARQFWEDGVGQPVQLQVAFVAPSQILILDIADF